MKKTTQNTQNQVITTIYLSIGIILTPIAFIGIITASIDIVSKLVS